MNRLLLLTPSLFGALLLTSTVPAYSRADASTRFAQPTTYSAASFPALASATDSGQGTLVRRLRHPLNGVSQADVNSLHSDTPGQNPGWLICAVILVGGAIFGLTHLRKS